MNFRIPALAFFVILSSCTSHKMTFNPKKIHRLEENGYQIKLDSLNIIFKNLLINPEKIGSLTKNNTEKTIQIKSKGEVKIIDGSMMLNLLKENYNVSEIDILIIDGVLSDSKMSNYFFDLESTKILVISKTKNLQEIFPHRNWKGDLVLLNTKSK